MQNAGSSIFDELESALSNGSSEQRLTILWRVMDLFLVDADRFNEEQIGVFDNVLCHLIERVEPRPLAQLSQTLAPVDSAPLDVTLRLAQHSEIQVAGPVLANSKRLSTEHLIDIAKIRSQQHLLAISHREEIESGITDILLDRGNRSVKLRVASNAGAQISENGFRILLKAAEHDEALAEKTGFRLDIPLQLRRELLLKATEAVRARLLSRTSPGFQKELQLALAGATEQIDRESSKSRNYDTAFRVAKLLHERGELTDTSIRRHASVRAYEDAVASLAVLCSLPVEVIKPLMESPRDEGLLIACKGAGLTWPTVCAILECRLTSGALPPGAFEKLEAEFEKLTRSNAERLLRFWRVKQIN